MENSDDVNPCSSQDEKLQSRPFIDESNAFSGMAPSSSTDEASEQATGIFMLSLPDSSDNYETPPEQHFYSQTSSSDGQVPATKAATIDLKVESGRDHDGEKTVADDGFEEKKKGMVDLTNDSDDLGLLEKSDVDLPDNADKALEDDNTPIGDIESENLVPTENTDKALEDTNRIESENVADKTEAGNSVTETPDTAKENADEVFVEMPVREKAASMSDTEVRSNMVTNRKRKSAGKDGEEEDNDLRDIDFIGILDVTLKILKKEEPSDDEDADFLKTAKLRGMTFPRPRWWPEGETDPEDSDY